MLPIKSSESANLPEVRAIDQRREMINFPEVKRALNNTELGIFEASTKTPIRDVPQVKMIEQVEKLSKFICRDIGIKAQIDQYDKTRFYDVLKRYYSDLTLNEIKLAFELSMVGELDAFLPKNSSGEPDKGHYQQFSVEYITKILQAYKRKKRGTVTKALNALPVHVPEFPEEEKLKLRRQFLNEFYFCFLKYKYSGQLEIRGILDYLIFMELVKMRLTDNDVEPTAEDRQTAFFQVMQKASQGLVNKYEAMIIEATKTKNTTVESRAYNNARTKRIKDIFDFIIYEQIQIIDLLKI